MEGGRRLRKMARKRSVVRVHSWKEVLFELPHENTGLEALHFHGEAKQFKIWLPFALFELPKQSILQTIKRFIQIIADIQCV
jgi:hypothetical protein